MIRRWSGAWQGALLGFAASLVAVLGACSSAPPPNSVPVLAAAAPLKEMRPISAEYLIQVGDELEVDVYLHPELSRHVVVRPDGRISLPRLRQEEMAYGVRPDVLARSLESAYRDPALALRDPQVTVIVQAFKGSRVYVGGEVQTPGEQDMFGDVTLLQAIVRAGGLKDTANAHQVLLVRRGADGKTSVLVSDMSSLLDQGNVGEDTYLKGLDVIWVPRSAIADVNIWVNQYLRQNIPIPFSMGFAP